MEGAVLGMGHAGDLDPDQGDSVDLAVGTDHFADRGQVGGIELGADPLAGAEMKAEVLEDHRAFGITEVDVFELHAGSAMHQLLGFGMVAQFMRHQQRRQGF